MQEGKKKRFALGKRKQTKDVKSNHWVESNKEVHVDATLASTINIDALK